MGSGQWLIAVRLARQVLGTFLLATLLTPAVARSVEPPTPADEREQAPDRPGEEDDLNQELWQFAKGTPYAQALQHIRQQRQLQRVTSPQAALPNGWRLSPAGKQVELGRLPYEAVLYNGRLVVLNNGFYGKEPQEISVIDLQRGETVKTLKLPTLFPSAQVGQDGDLYISSGFGQKVVRLNAQFETVREYSLQGYTAGLAALDRSHLAVAYLVTEKEMEAGGKAYDRGKVAILNTETGRVEREVEAGYFPYHLQFVNGKLYLTLAGENRVQVYDRQLKLLKTLAIGGVPQNMCHDGQRLYAVNTLSDSLSVIDTRQDAVVSTLSVRYRDFRSGSSPTSCWVAGTRLYVTQAELNAIAVLDKGSGKRLGFIPTGWYPTKVVQTGEQLLVLSAKGIHPRRPNPKGPQPIPEKGGPEYVLTLLQGALSIIPQSAIARNLPTWTQQVEMGSPLYSPRTGLKLPIRHVFYIVKENRTYDQILGDLGRGNGDASLTLFGQSITPNHHQLARNFVTLDNFFVNGEISVLGHSFTTSGYASPFLEWLGNMNYSGRYNGYPFGIVPVTFSPAYLWNALDAKGVDYRIYGEPYYLFTRAYQIITETYGADSPIARQFYAQSMRLAAQVDRGKELSQIFQKYYGQADTPAAVLRLLQTSEFRQFLSQVFMGNNSLDIALQQNPTLRRKFADFLAHYPFNYHYYDLAYSDLKRYQDWRVDFEKQLKSGQVAALHYIWLPNDHTAGTNPKFPNPYQLIAQNDAALGLIVQTIARSPIWKDSLILVTEDDAQNGPDHVDATRSVALAAGPFVKRDQVMSDRFDQLSLLRTIEVIFGLSPLNLGDALAVPMFGIFSDRPNLTPYTPPPPSQQLMESDRSLYQSLHP
jgi:YVTN family beta-propeller protein